MANYVSPGVYSREIDQSTYATQLSTTTVGMVGLSKKGVVNVPTLVTNMNQFIEKFGEPTDDFPYSGLAAEQYFNYGNTMYFTRVVPITENGNEGATHARHQSFSLTGKAVPSGGVYTIPDNATSLRWDFEDHKMTTSFSKTKEAIGNTVISSSGIFFDSIVNATTRIKGVTNSTALISTIGTAASGHYIQITNGAGKNQVRMITGVVSGSDGAGTITVAEDWTINPSVGDNVRIVPDDNVIKIDLGSGTSKPLTLLIGGGSTAKKQADILADINKCVDEQLKGSITASFYNNRLKIISSYDMTFTANAKLGFIGTTYQGTWTQEEVIDKIKNLLGNEKGHLGVRFDEDNKVVFYSPFSFSMVGVINNCDAIFPIASLPQAASGTLNTDGHKPIYGADYKMTTKENFVVNASANTMTITVGSEVHTFVVPTSKYGSYNAKTFCDYLNDTRLFNVNATSNWSASSEKLPLVFFPKNGKIIAVSKDETIASIILGGTNNTLGSILGYGEGDTIDTEYGDPDAYVWFPFVENAGKWGNDIRIRIWYGTITGCTISIDAWDKVLQDWKEIESHNNIVFDESETDSEHTYVGNINSELIMFDKTGNMINETDPDAVYGTSTSYPQPGIYYLTGGIDGDINADAIIDEIVGTAAVDTGTGWATGLHSFADPEKIDLNTIIVPYFSQFPEVHTVGVALCEARNECEFIIDTPQGLTTEQIIDWANGSYGQNRVAINSSFSAIYWPHQEYYDSYNDKKRWLPPSGFVVGQYAYNDQVGSVYSSAAGLNRGRLLKVTDIEYNASQGERVMLTQNGVNCIVNFLKEGVTIWDDITTLRKSSALKDNNVRRGLNYVKKVCASLSKYYCFEPNDEFTWNSIKSAIGSFLSSQKRAFYSFKVQCDSDTNSNIQINNGIMRVVIYLEFVRTAKIVQLDFVVMKTGGITVLNSIA